MVVWDRGKNEQVVSKTMSMVIEDGVTLSGTLYPSQGDTAVILAHMMDSSQADWWEFASRTSGRGYALLTFDFRYNGKSECKSSKSDPNNLKDILAAYDFLKEKGYKRLVCMGASLGGAACLELSVERELAGLAILGGLFPPFWAKEYPQDLKSTSMPNLFIISDKNPHTFVIEETRKMYDTSLEPRQLKVFQTNAHGTDIFKTKDKEKLTTLLLDFLEECMNSKVKVTHNL